MKTLSQHIRTWWRRRRSQRKALILLRDLFGRPELLSGTSLKPHHAGRSVYVDHQTDENGEIIRVCFGILRHPRPYSFSKQSHKVIEYYTFDVTRRRLIRERGINITRARGLDAD